MTSRLRRFIPQISAFIAGGAVMSMELLGSRLVAPFLGSSVLIWTNLIGIVLIALAAGAWWGGRVADRYPRPSLIAWLFGISGIWMLGLALFSFPFLGWMSERVSLELATPLSSLVLLALPAFCLGAIPPATLRLVIQDVSQSGQVAGVLSAIGTAGSLCGTYLTGYVLLPRFSVFDILIASAAALCVIAVCVMGSARERVIPVCILVFLFGFSATRQAVDPFEPLTFPSAYASVLVYEGMYHDEPARFLRINTGAHAIASPDSPHRSIARYVQGMRVVDVLVPTPTRVLALGGGGFHVGREILERHPEAQVETIEIDPAVVQASRAAFDLEDDPRLSIRLADARPALREVSPGYDLILSDVYSGDTSVPWYLLTQEALADTRNLLAPQGVFVGNFIFPTQAEAPAARRFQANLFATLQTAFSWSFGISVMNGEAVRDPANIIVFAGNGSPPDPTLVLDAVRDELRSDRPVMIEKIAGGRVWTDRFGTADYESVAMYREAAHR